MFGKLVGWLTGVAREANRANAEMRGPEERGRHSSPATPEELVQWRRGESSGEGLDRVGLDDAGAERFGPDGT